MEIIGNPINCDHYWPVRRWCELSVGSGAAFSDSAWRRNHRRRRRLLRRITFPESDDRPILQFFIWKFLMWHHKSLRTIVQYSTGWWLTGTSSHVSHGLKDFAFFIHLRMELSNSIEQTIFSNFIHSHSQQTYSATICSHHYRMFTEAIKL